MKSLDLCDLEGLSATAPRGIGVFKPRPGAPQLHGLQAGPTELHPVSCAGARPLVGTIFRSLILGDLTDTELYHTSGDDKAGGGEILNSETGEGRLAAAEEAASQPQLWR